MREIKEGGGDGGKSGGLRVVTAAMRSKEKV